MKLLGLLYYLWNEARLNQWKAAFAGKRRASLSYWWLNNAADNVRAGQVRLVDQLLLAAFGVETRESQRNRMRAEAALEANHRMLLISPLAPFSPERFDYRNSRTNANEGGKRSSLHCKAQALDLRIEGVSADALSRFGHYLGGGGVGYYPPKTLPIWTVAGCRLW
jgi:hypothetical protein